MTYALLAERIRSLAGELSQHPRHTERDAARLVDIVDRLHQLADYATKCSATTSAAVAVQRLANDLLAALILQKGDGPVAPQSVEELPSLIVGNDYLDVIREQGLQVQVDEFPDGYTLTLVER